MASFISRMGKRLKDPSLIIGALSAFGVKLLAAGGAFLLNVIVARNLGAEQAGYFFLALAVCIMIANLTRQGLNNALVRFIAGYRVSGDIEKVGGLFKYASLRVFFVGCLVSLILYFLSPWLSNTVFNKPLLTPILEAASFLIVPLALSQLIGFCFQGMKKVVPAIFYQSALLATLAVVVLWLLSPDDSLSAIWIYVICTFTVATLAFLHWLKVVGRTYEVLGARDKYEVNQAIKPLFLILLMSQVTQWAGQLVLGIWSTPHEVALFATAQRTAMLTSFILVAVNAIAAPKFAEAFKKNRHDEIEQIALSSSRLMTAAAIPVLIFMVIFAPWLMSLFGPSFAESAIILRILAVGQFINVITGSVGYLLQMTANERVLRNNMAISTLILVVGSVIFTPILGMLGVAVITALAIATQNILCIYQVKRIFGFNTLNIFAR
ncbi:oligosaccharide flippase family protein [Vibrio hippocampi]|uniref:Polysaccharide biosynthesis protein C-terminal domain-containing protein n=1 Tax=Vibrio hippocampi TaxID=654686 RepID=A0ABM8ZKR0_9VIBR|nr:oligosaccharide flippase family protein [Vibrio hippocampi]CAH0527266.1 hypothetical protein VHP8226_02594 [Vibrio hippocampi]